ncbi:hypothetical protein CHLRE_06g299476v5 [Chlamydomonas reinhardtii]|mgnify:CR=1 FL=1|uniref:Uncharacterized protein n=1 Tax=Chlamydomonas reinhardtii TaxID=3055 RepID=A0A2K3DQU6_CHLRE|nr:uncharacterized protein CHLRE_06g299476v5 [Chlamydomonas reinhardtii]PNW82915.1 hypothetical protein CHLRE_06g299476v5 [Chlamydomonas reinhardtii]
MGGSVGPPRIAARRLDQVQAAFPPVQQSVSAMLAAEFLQAHVTPNLQHASVAQQKAVADIAEAAKQEAELAKWERKTTWLHRLLMLVWRSELFPGVRVWRMMNRHNRLIAAYHSCSAAYYNSAAACLRLAAAQLRLGAAAGPLRSRAAAANAAAAACSAAADQSTAAAAVQEEAQQRRLVLAESTQAAMEAAARRVCSWPYLLLHLALVLVTQWTQQRLATGVLGPWLVLARVLDLASVIMNG